MTKATRGGGGEGGGGNRLFHFNIEISKSTIIPSKNRIFNFEESQNNKSLLCH